MRIPIFLALPPFAATQTVFDPLTPNVAYNIWGALKPGPGLTNGWASDTLTLTEDFTCFSGIPGADRCTLAPNYRVSYDPTTDSAAESYLADSGNWQSGTLHNEQDVDDDGLSPWCVSCCDNTRTEYIFNETFAMECPGSSNPTALAIWETQLSEALNSNGASSATASASDCPRYAGTGATCDELLNNAANTCLSLEEEGFDCSGCICGEEQGLGYAWWQFRFARKDTWESTEVISCDLFMPVENGDKLYYGYSLTILAVEHSDSNGNIWRGVEKCHAIGISTDLSPEAQTWWDGLGREENQPCWTDSSTPCLYQQITVTNENEWCESHYAYTGQVAGKYESGFDDEPSFVSGQPEQLSSDPTFEELDGQVLLEADPTYVFTLTTECGTGIMSLHLGICLIFTAIVTYLENIIFF
jgi:hypothetical protein